MKYPTFVFEYFMTEKYLVIAIIILLVSNFTHEHAVILSQQEAFSFGT